VTRLAGTHVCITGGSSGIGLALAQRCVDRGAAMSILARDEGRLDSARHELQARRAAARIATASVDVTDAAALRTAIDAVVAELGPIDVLVTCAGYAQPGLVTELDDAVFREEMDVNYFGSLNAVRAVLPSMVERRRGHVVLVASTAALIGVYGYSAYAPAKYAVRGLAETLRPECRTHGVVVACAYPPDTETPGLEAENAYKPEATKRISANIRPRAAAAVADAIIRGIERNHLIITADPTTAALARAGGLVAPLVNRWLDRQLREPEARGGGFDTTRGT
jgi:3-dehydrosphinganine reductase